MGMRDAEKMLLLEPITIMWSEPILLQAEDNETPTVSLDLKTKECRSWSDIVELDLDPEFKIPFMGVDPEFKIPFMGDRSDSMAWMMGTKKQWLSCVGTATHQLMARELCKIGALKTSST
jgi:hypothetical protein